ncbi:MAG TPA: hypothetical protein VHN99_11080 [Deinococcales bacterium]|nr:hypothetical protein [Deinococcales bacterium]
MSFKTRLDALRGAVERPQKREPRPCTRAELEAVLTALERFKARRPLTREEEAVRLDVAARLRGGAAPGDERAAHNRGEED